MHTAVKREILGASQSHSRGGYTLDSGVVGKVGKKYCALDCARLFKVVDEVLSLFESNTYRCKYNCKLTFVVLNFCLPGNLSGKLGMRQSAH